MHSTSHSTGVNTLIAAEANSGSSQKSSLLNPTLDSKSLNTKEFSEVFDDQQAREKVSASSKLSHRGSDPLGSDSASLNKSTVELVGNTADFAADTGKPLPHLAIDLPLVEGGLSGGATETSSFIVAAVQRADNDGLAASLVSLPPVGLAEVEVASDHAAVVAAEALDSAEPEQLTAATLLAAGSVVAEARLFNATSESTAEAGMEKRNGLAPAGSSSLAALNQGDSKHSALQPAGLALSNDTVPMVGMGRQDMAAGGAPFAAAMTAMESVAQAGRLAKGQVSQRLEGGEALATTSASINATALSATEVAQAYKTAAQPVLPTNAALQPGNASFSDAVMQRVMWMSSQQINRADIALDPPELGSLQVRVSTQSEHTSVVFSSPHSAVREALDQGLPRLRDMLEQQGLNLADVDVSDQSAHQQQGEHPAAGLAAGDRDDADSDSGTDGPAAATAAEPQQHALQLVDHYV
jgi:flagellar hook-length control protein FliK